VTLMVAPALLALFIAAFALRRFSLVRAGRYHAGKAFVQVGLMVLVLTLALPGSLERYRAAGPVRAVDLARHLRSADADARAMAAELARHRERKEALRHLPRLIEMLDDPSAEVRRQATATLIDLAGEDAAPGEDDARSLWRAWWRAHGADVP